MARIAGVDIPREKRVEISLTYIYGIGRTLSNKILKKVNINPDTRVKDLTDEQVISFLISLTCSSVKSFTLVSGLIFTFFNILFDNVLPIP